MLLAGVLLALAGSPASAAATPDRRPAVVRQCGHNYRNRRVRRCRSRFYWRRRYRKIPSWGRAWLRSTAQCESGGNPRAHNGPHHGKYQFLWNPRDGGTARSAGFRGDPHRAYEREQDVRAWRWRQRAGAGQWPVCGR